MTNARYFDEGAEEAGSDAGAADYAVRAMARRQFGVSLVVGFALLAVAGLIAVQSPRGASTQTAARHRIVMPQAPQVEFAAPMAQAPTKG